MPPVPETRTVTTCYANGAAHPFPVEDNTGAHCPEHGVTLLWHVEPNSADSHPGTHPPGRARPHRAPSTPGGST
ncbi:hypothetical protein DBP12_36545 [Streptomyces sp. CS014]|nr:hypothetical protein DBP12_36545 [Streptomyces sp. CS014]